MARKSTLVKVFVALAAFFVAAPWAAGTSNIAEGESSSVYCVKLVGDEDGSYIELSQKAANASVQGEQCYEWWYTQDGSPSAYSALQEFFQANYPPSVVMLTSDLSFGGYDGSRCASGANAYHPFDFGTEEGVTLSSYGDSLYTIKNLCYQGGASEASFSGYLFTSIVNVSFDSLHLESQTSAGLFSFNVETANVMKVRVSHSVVMAPVAGTLAGAIGSITISGFSGKSITVNAIPEYDDGESFSTNEVSIGSLVGYCSSLYVATTRIDSVNVLYQPVSGRSYLDAALPDGNAYVGGLVGSVASIEGADLDKMAVLHQVGLENMEIVNDADGDGVNHVGGLFGQFEGATLSVMRTYTVGNILCTSESCVQGYGAGLIKFIQYPQVTVVANYHYSENEQERAQAFAGMVVGRYLTEYADAGVTGAPDTVITDEFNKSGYIPNYIEEYVDDERIFVKDDVSVASGNYRNAVGSISATEGFDSEAYTFDDPAEGTVSNGVLEGEYMRSAKFIEILDHIPGVLTADDVEWKFDDSQATPYFDISTDDSGDSGEDYVQPAEVYFSFDCVNYGNCLTEDELLALEPFENNREDPDGYTYKFVVGSDGTIENTEWLDFVFNLTLENPDRERVYWYTSYNQKFSKYNVYDANTYYYLMKGEPEEDDPEEIDIAEKNSYVFFGRGMNFDSTIVEIFSYEGESVEEIGDMRDMMSYSGGDQPIELQTGGVIRVVARNPVTTDGREFKGWVLRAALAPSTSADVLREIAFDGVDIPVDEDGYANLSEYSGQMDMRFEESILGECAVFNQNNPDIELDSLQKLAEVCSRKSAEIEKAYESAVFVMAIFPKGFEEENGIFDIPDHHDQHRDTILAEVEYPALFQSGNGIQLAVKTDEFVYEESAPFVSVLLEDLSGEPLVDTLFEFTDGEWPETFTWEKYPLAPGRYLLTAKIYDGKNQNPDIRQWDFEVKAQIADECSDCWYMVSLSNVVLDKVNPSDVNVLYWWNEQSVNGKYWQYEEVERVSDVDRARGYWYNSIEDLPLELDGESLDDDVVVWEIDSVYSGWNMVRNPFGWYIDVSDLKRQGYAYYSWNSEAGNYRTQPRYIKPYESFWVKTGRYEVLDLPSTPAFVDMVDADGNTVPRLSLQKKQVLAKAAGAEDWNVQISLFDMKGKADTWNELGVGKAASALEEPPAGMGDHVNLTIVDAGRRLAKSVKEENRDAAYEWNVEISATSARMGYLKVEGVDALRAYGLRAFLTVDGVTTELSDDGKVQVGLSTTPKTATLRIASAARKVVASTLQGLRAHDLGSTLQVGFDVGEGLAGANARVDLVDMKGHVVNTAGFKAEAGRNEISLERPVRGLYVLRAAVGREVAVQKILLR